MIGHINGIEVGQFFSNRKKLHDAGVHRGWIQGISAQGESIVLSGGYKDDIDDGDTIIYTGQGGRDDETGNQIADQELKRGNLYLAEHHVQGNPIRVVRGSQLNSKYAPSYGYRYDGLYRIERYWKEKGKDGFDIFRYKLRRLDNQKSLDDILVGRTKSSNETESEITEAPRTNDYVSRIIRNTHVGNKVKKMYDYHCQICGTQIVTPSGPYAECCHIKPLGRPHNGPDVIENVLCLCPNHHVMLDTHVLHISDDFKVIETGDKLNINKSHHINVSFLDYHRSMSANKEITQDMFLKR